MGHRTGGHAVSLHHGLYEAHLPVTELDRSIAFYAEVLDFRVAWREENADTALLGFERAGVRWMLGLFTVEAVGHRHPAEYHVAFRVEPTDAERMIPFLRSRGVEPRHPPHAPLEGPMTEPIVHGWMPAAAVFFRDPDGHLLELIAELGDEPQPAARYVPLSRWRRTP